MNDCTPIDIICPTCQALAKFNEPFLFCTRLPDGETRPYHQWGGWIVVEKYPSQLPWTPPKRTSSQYLRGGGGDAPGYPLMHKGVVHCDNCHTNIVHILSWPGDAWYQWEIRGKLLFAWHRADALAILDFISAKDRPHRYLNGPAGRVPTHFLTANMRELVCEKIRARLGKH